jgi:uncharacterized protein YcbK (DUF882 family)
MPSSPQPKPISRRAFLKGTCAAAATLLLPAPLMAHNKELITSTLRFYNLHTDESLTATYIDKGKFVPDAITAIDHILRDFRTGDIMPIDLNLLTTLSQLHYRTGSAEPFQIISGYRSPKTNEMLYEHTNGVKKNSLHMQGRAIDIRLADVELTDLRNAAIALQRGGVGYYEPSQFVHVDTGVVQTW